MYPKVWKALARVATSERGYEELAETLDRLEDEQPVALRHAVQPQLAPPEQRLAAEAVSSRVGEHTLPFLISSMSFGSQGETAFRAYAEAAYPGRHALHERRGRRDPGHVRASYPKHRGQQIASGRFGVSSLLINSSEWVEIKIGQGAKPGEGGHLPGSKVTQAIARGAQRPGRQRPDQPVEQPRPLLDRGPGAAHRRAEDVEPAREGHRQGAGRPRHRHDRHRHRQGGRRRHHDVGLRRRHRRRPPARAAARRACPARSAPCSPTTPSPRRASATGSRSGPTAACAAPPTASSSSAWAPTGWASARRRWSRSAARSAAAASSTPATSASRPRSTGGGGRRARPQALRAARARAVGRRRWCATSPRWATALRELAGQMGVSEVQELVGQADRLVQVSHHERLDLTSLLTPVRERVITSPAGTPRFFRPFHPPPPAPRARGRRRAARRPARPWRWRRRPRRPPTATSAPTWPA